MKAAVIYYSLEGNTRLAANQIAEKLSADLIELKPVKAYPTKGAAKYFWGGKSATFKERPPLEKYTFHAGNYDLLIVGTPVWAGGITPPVRTFLCENDLSGKTVAAFVCCSGGSSRKSLDTIKALAGADALKAELTLVDPLKNNGGMDEKICAFCSRLSGG